MRGGDLLDGPNGERIGEFFTSGFCLETPFGPQNMASSNLEFQTFVLPKGTLSGSGRRDRGRSGHLPFSAARAASRRPVAATWSETSRPPQRGAMPWSSS